MLFADDKKVVVRKGLEEVNGKLGKYRKALEGKWLEISRGKIGISI